MDANLARGSYDAVANVYAEAFFDELSRKPFDCDLLDVFAAKCTDGPVLDVGCGPGHVARYLHDRGVVATGVDVSPEMVAVAQHLNPGLTFTIGDMRSIGESFSLSGLVAFYSLIHLGRDEVPAVLRRFRHALVGNGRLLIAVHGGSGEISRDEFLGQPVPFQATLFSLGEIVTLVESAGFLVDQAFQRAPYEFEHPTPRIYVAAHVVPVITATL